MVGQKRYPFAFATPQAKAANQPSNATTSIAILVRSDIGPLLKKTHFLAEKSVRIRGLSMRLLSVPPNRGPGRVTAVRLKV